MVRILTDSSAGFTLEDANKIGVEMVYLPINFDGKEYLDILELSHKEFYVQLKASKVLPRTSAVNQAAFEEVFRDVKKKGDEMVVLLISSGISATTGQAVAAKQAVGYDKIHVIDTLCAAPMLIALVDEAVKMRDSKKSMTEIVAQMERLAPRVRLYAYVDTLKYLRAGGRISGASAIVGSIIGVKPIVGLIDGKVANLHKTIGVKKAQDYILEKLKNADFAKPIYFGHTNVEAECEKLKEKAKQIHPHIIDGGTWFISATIATHAGPGAGAIVFFEHV